MHRVELCRRSVTVRAAGNEQVRDIRNRLVRFDDGQPVLPDGPIDVLIRPPGLRFQIDDELRQVARRSLVHDFPGVGGVGLGHVTVEGSLSRIQEIYGAREEQ